MPDETESALPRPPAPEALRERLATIEGMGPGRRRLVVVWGQLGDFDSLEYAQALVPVLPRLELAGISVLAFGIGNEIGRARFCGFTGFPPERLVVDPEPTLHQALALCPGLQLPIGPWGNLLLMCAGIGSPGTLKEVLRGYTGDRSAPQRIADDEMIHAPPLPPIRGSLFVRAGGTGFQRPFELATIRLRNMGEGLATATDNAAPPLPRRSGEGTFLLGTDDSLLNEHREQALLGFSGNDAAAAAVPGRVMVIQRSTRKPVPEPLERNSCRASGCSAPGQPPASPAGAMSGSSTTL